MGSKAEGRTASDIIIDRDNNVYSKEDIIAYLTQFGYHLIYMGAFDNIIELEQRSRPIKNASNRFYATCAIAYYQRGNQLYQGLALMADAQKGIRDLEPEMAAYLEFITIDTKKRLNLLKPEEYNTAIDELFQKEHIGPFFKIERAWRKLHSSSGSFAVKLPEFYAAIEHILDKEPRDFQVRNFGYSRIQDIESQLAIHDLTVAVHNAVCAGEVHRLPKLRKKWDIFRHKFDTRMQQLQFFAFNVMDLQIAVNLPLSPIIMDYAGVYIFAFYENWDPETESSEINIPTTDRNRLLHHCNFLWNSSKELEKFGRFETLMNSLILRFKMLHLLEAETAMAETEKMIRDTIDKYELQGYREELDDLIENGMDHDHLFWDSIDLILLAYENQRNEKQGKTSLNDPRDQNRLKGLDFQWAVEEPYRFNFPVIPKRPPTPKT